MRCAWNENMFQVDQAGLLSPRRKTQVGADGMPFSASIRHFQAEAMRLGMAPLADGNVHGRISRMQPSFGNEPYKPFCGHIVAQIHFYVVIASKPLILPPPEGIKIFAVELAYNFGYILAAIVDGFGDGLRGSDGDYRRLDRRYDKAFVGENLCAYGVVNDHQLQVVVVVGFPEFARQSQVVIPIPRRELIAADFVPLFSSSDAGLTYRVDLQAERRAPGHRIFYETDLLAIPGK